MGSAWFLVVHQKVLTPGLNSPHPQETSHGPTHQESTIQSFMSPWIQQDANLPIVWCDIDCSAKIKDTDIHLFVQINGFLKVSESS